MFGSELNKEINELKRNVEVKPVTGATLYRHCLEDLNDRLTSMGEELAAVEAVSLDAISLEVSRSYAVVCIVLLLSCGEHPTPYFRI